ncbi:MAG: hypothetical protein NVS4B3_08180 [Gemmatimonadaceae bacterium]
MGMSHVCTARRAANTFTGISSLRQIGDRAHADSRWILRPDRSQPIPLVLSVSRTLGPSAVAQGRLVADIPYMPWLRLVLALMGRAIRDPSVGLDLLRVGWRFRRRRWYRQFPFLPVPSRIYLRWRIYTAYGSYDAVPPAADVVRYARWAVRD